MERVEVGIRELRLNLSRYVARAKTGTEVIVTDRGRPVARLDRDRRGGSSLPAARTRRRRHARAATEEHIAPAADTARGRRTARKRDGARGPALIAYFDSSAFVKLLLRRARNRRRARALLRGDTGLLVPTAGPRSFVGARPGDTHRRARHASSDERSRPRATLLGDVGPVEVDAVLADRAWDLASAFDLRGYDAVHLGVLRTRRRRRSRARRFGWSAGRSRSLARARGRRARSLTLAATRSRQS